MSNWEVEVRRTGLRNTTLKVYPDGRVKLTVPQEASEQYVEDFLERKQKWLEAALKNKDQASDKLQKMYVSGETVRYLGRQVRLKVIEGTEEGVAFSRGYMQITVSDKDDVGLKKMLIEGFFRQKAQEKLVECLNRVYKQFSLYIPEKPALNIRQLERRWGSYSKKTHSILLNQRLIHRSRSLIEYVVAHELCHFLHPNHTAEFYRFLTLIMPDWRDRKDKLEETAEAGYEGL